VQNEVPPKLKNNSSSLTQDQGHRLMHAPSNIYLAVSGVRVIGNRFSLHSKTNLSERTRLEPDASFVPLTLSTMDHNFFNALMPWKESP
jgi:hypothetical protein